jgi:hypothetical protein
MKMSTYSGFAVLELESAIAAGADNDGQMSAEIERRRSRDETIVKICAYSLLVGAVLTSPWHGIIQCPLSIHELFVVIGCFQYGMIKGRRSKDGT